MFVFEYFVVFLVFSTLTLTITGDKNKENYGFHKVQKTTQSPDYFGRQHQQSLMCTACTQIVTAIKAYVDEHKVKIIDL
jgi:hypothetical protein